MDLPLRPVDPYRPLGGLFGLVKRRHPSYQCRLRLGDAARVAVGYVVMLIVWSQYIKYKNAWG